MIRLALALTLVLASVTLAGTDDPRAAEAALLRLVPPDAGVTLAVVDLRGQVEAIGSSTLARRFGALPAVLAWRGSPAGRQFGAARERIELGLGAKLPAIVDGLIGDAAVLTLHLPDSAPTDGARGLLLTRVRDRALLNRLIEMVNAAETARGALVEVADVGEGGRRYRARRFKPGTKEAEFYRLFDDGTFAWSNSEDLLKGVLDRRAGVGPGLGDDPAFRALRAGLPSRSLAWLHASPRLADRLLAATPKSGNPGDDRAAEIVTRYLRTVRAVGLALEWRDGLLLHSHELFDPEQVDPRLRRWAKSGASPDALARRVPNTALAASAASIDLEGASEAVADLLADDDRAGLEAALGVLRGVMLGRDVRKEILPSIGPALIAYVEAPAADSTRFPAVGVLELRDDKGEPTVAAALDNALRTILCVYALDPKHRLPVESYQAGPLRVTSLGGPGSPFAYGLGRDCLVVGTSADAVSRFGTAEPDGRLAPLKSKFFPDARVYAAVDIARLAEAARRHRLALAARFGASRGASPEAAARDLDQALALLDLFEGAFFAVAVDPAFASIHQTIGLVARQ